MESGVDVSSKIGDLEKNVFDQTDFLCCVCTNKETRTDATKYCLTCEYCYCKECADLHSIVPSLFGHVIVEKTDFNGWEDITKFPPIPTERCAHHPARILDMYCGTHDQVGCDICMTEEHDESCNKLYIPENLDSLYNTNEIKRSEQNLHSSVQQVEEELHAREKCLADVSKLLDDAEKQLEIYADQIIKTVTLFKQNTRAKLDSIRNERAPVLLEQKVVLNTVLGAAKDILQKASRAFLDSRNKSQQITCSNLAKMAVQKCKEVKNGLVSPDVPEISFHPHLACEDLLGPLQKYSSLGKINVSLSGEKSAWALHKIVKKVETNVKVKGERFNSHIPGSCALKDGSILLADSYNKCIKRLSPDATFVFDYLKLSDSPRSVHMINHKEAAITLPDQKQVRIVNYETTMYTTRILKLDFKCRGITHYDNELFISDKNKVYVYTVEGKLLRQLSGKNTEETCFTYIYNMAMSDYGRVLFVADVEKGLIAIEKETGRRLWCYAGDDLVGPSSVCVDKKGGVFVCGCFSRNILQFNEGGEIIGNVVTWRDRVVVPWSVCFITNTSTLVVTQWRNDTIMQYQLTT